MSNPYVGEIRMLACNFAPNGWAFCNGQSMQITEYETLFDLIGTTYGGDGQTTFNLPDLRGRVMVGQGTGYSLGQEGGAEAVTLTSQTIPQHNHLVQASTATGTTTKNNGGIYAAIDPTGKISSQTPALFAAPAGTVTLQTETKPVGGNIPHSNIQPYQAINFCISLFGVFPSQA